MPGPSIALAGGPGRPDFAPDFCVVPGLSTADGAQVASAFFTALTALAAFASVTRVERDRWRAALPELHMEVVLDVPNDEVRLIVVNHGGPAREVRVMGTIGDYGFAGHLAPVTYWRSGESRSFVLAMPLVLNTDVKGFVEGRDLAKRHLVLATPGGATYRWPLRKAKRLSAEKEWHKLYPGEPGPLDVPYTPIAMTLADRSV
jgi:hypothetical protein